MAEPEREPLDRELPDLPPDLRWREWMARVEAVIFANAEPVTRDTLLRLVGRDCPLDLLIEDIRTELKDRPYDLVRVGGGWQHRTRPKHAAAIRIARGEREGPRDLTRGEAFVITCIAYLQPVTRNTISRLLGREVSRDIIGRLSRSGLIARGPRSPEPGAPYTYVTTTGFLQLFGLESLRDLPDMEALEDSGLLNPVTGISDPLADLPIAGELRELDEGEG